VRGLHGIGSGAGPASIGSTSVLTLPGAPSAVRESNVDVGSIAPHATIAATAEAVHAHANRRRPIAKSIARLA
jgi:hypothetical protein